MVKKRATPFITEFENIPADALVPEDNQPYEIPGHWKWVRLGAVLHGMETRKPSGDIFMYIDIGSVDNALQEIREPKHVQTSKAPSRASRAVHAGATLFSVVRPYLRNIALIEDDLAEAVASTGFYVCNPIDVVDSVFLFEYLRSEVFIDLMTTKMRGDNSPSIRADDLREAAFPLPPIDEQKAIVEKLKSTNQKIDDVLERLDQFLDQAPQHRAAIIQAGVSGMLTEDWRIENGLSLDDWLDGVVGDFVSIDSQLVDPAGYPDFPHIAPDRIEKTSGRLLEYHSVREDGVSSGKQHFFPGQVLYSKIRPYLSKAVHVNFEGLCSADMYPLSTIGSARFLWYFVLSPVFVEAASNAGSRTVLPKINQKELRALPAMIPDAVEQHEIARVLDVATERLQASVDAVDQAKTLLMQMKNAVRTRALRGLV